jgi:hypothetical protein
LWPFVRRRIPDLGRFSGLKTLLLAFALMSGCAPPIPVVQAKGPMKSSRTNLDERTSSRIVPKQTTRTQTLLMLGEPDGRGPDDSWFSYGSMAQRGGLRVIWYTYYGDWDSSQRLLIRFDEHDVVSSVQFVQRNCTDAMSNCLELTGADLFAVDDSRVAASGRLLAHYDNDVVEWWSSPTCRLKDRSRAVEAGNGNALRITEHAIFWQDRRDGISAGHPWRMLSFDEIQEVLPVADDGVWQWIGVRKRSGGCLFVHVSMFADPKGWYEAEQLRSTIVAYLSPKPAVPAEATRLR